MFPNSAVPMADDYRAGGIALEALRMPEDVAEQFFSVRRGYFDDSQGVETGSVLSFRKN
jgi:hypothetical protein